MKKLREPESLRQARTWESYTRRYQRAGLCRGCAGQAAYGHQHSFSAIRDPCAECRLDVADFLTATVNPVWRALWRP